MPGAPVVTPAIVLGAVRYGETSRIVRLLTRDDGVVSAIAKGALRPRSRFGAALQLLSEGDAHLIPARSSELFTLAAFDVTQTHGAVANHLDRFAAATALAEMAGRFVPPGPHARVYAQVHHDLSLIEVVPANAIPVVAIRAMWRLVVTLGVAPTVSVCARDGATLAAGMVPFSLRDGGFLCPVCARAGASTRLGITDRDDLVALLSTGDLPVLDSRQAAAHRRLVLRWVREHLGESSMPALEAWASC